MRPSGVMAMPPIVSLKAHLFWQIGRLGLHGVAAARQRVESYRPTGRVRDEVDGNDEARDDFGGRFGPL